MLLVLQFIPRFIITHPMATTTPPYTFTFHFVNARETIALGVVMSVVCIFIVALRFLVRYRQEVKIGVDDWLSSGGLVSITQI